MKSGIYIHWPFCLSKCPYCDFNSHVSNSIDHAQWLDAYLKELDRYYNLAPSDQIKSIFFGGGTPYLMDPKTVSGIIQKIKTLWNCDNEIEVTLEANPTSIEIEKFKAFKGAGINRVSIGIQALNDEDLKFLGRTHSAKEAKKALEIGSSVFENCSFDLIYARPKQTTQSWKAELEKALSFGTKHLSLYQLTIEQGTKFYTLYQRGDFALPDENLSSELYEMTEKITGDFGLKKYEVSNYAKPGYESKHNLLYWNYDDYIGIGPGAHGRITMEDKKYATEQIRAPKLWLESVLEKDSGDKSFLAVNQKEQFWEKLLMGLRLSKGCNFKDWQQFVAPEKIHFLEKEGLLKVSQEHIQCTESGFLKMNSIVRYLNG